MKNILKNVFLLIAMLVISSCEKQEKDPVVSPNGFTLLKDITISSPTVLTNIISSSVFTKLNWNKSDNGVSSVATYTLVVFDKDNDPNLLNPAEYVGSGVLVTPDSRTATLTVAEFNTTINKLQTYKCSEMNIDIRIKSKLGVGPNPFVQYSNPVNVKVTGYSTSKKILSFVKDGNTPVGEPQILSSSFSTNSDFEGYMYLQPGNYKFYQPDDCGNFATPNIFGGTGTLANGTIDGSATSQSITIVNANHYLVKVNLNSNTFSAKEIRAFGVFGNATRSGGSFLNTVPMTYDASSKKWKITMELIIGKNFKFKSNFWVGGLTPSVLPNLDFVPGSASTFISILGKKGDAGALEEDLTAASEITVPGTFDNNARKKYDIELDVSNPRKYTYTLTLNPN